MWDFLSDPNSALFFSFLFVVEEKHAIPLQFHVRLALGKFLCCHQSTRFNFSVVSFSHEGYKKTTTLQTGFECYRKFLCSSLSSLMAAEMLLPLRICVALHAKYSSCLRWFKKSLQERNFEMDLVILSDTFYSGSILLMQYIRE